MALLKVVYVREWRLTQRLTAGVGQWFQGLIIRIKAHYWRRKHRREMLARPDATPPPANDPLPDDEPPDGPDAIDWEEERRDGGDA